MYENAQNGADEFSAVKLFLLFVISELNNLKSLSYVFLVPTGKR